MPIRRRFQHQFGRDDAAATRPVIDDDLLAERFAEAVPDDARSAVISAAGRQRNDQPQRMIRKILRERARNNQQRCGRKKTNHGMPRVLPPSTLIAVPVIIAACLEARNTVSPAISSGTTTRPIGTSRTRCLVASSIDRPRSFAVMLTSSVQRPVSVEPGQIALTVMPNGPNSFASALVI